MHRMIIGIAKVEALKERMAFSYDIHETAGPSKSTAFCLIFEHTDNRDAPRNV